MRDNLTISDLFCGAGGSSTGAVLAGLEVKTAANHWQLAIDSHAANHPHTDHICDDIQQTHPSLYPRTTMLWASPSCTNHSLAKGRKRKGATQLDMFSGQHVLTPEEIRSRATMREVVEFTDYHRYEVIVVENVVDIRYWEHFDSWIMDMMNMGYRYQLLYLNSMFFDTPQSRDRFYAVFWKDGNRAPDLRFSPKAYCPHCEKMVEARQVFKKSDFQWGRYKRQYIYKCAECRRPITPPHRPAADVIDWSLPAPKIGDRKKPLNDSTIRRVRAGLERYKDQAVMVNLQYTKAGDGSMIYSVSDTLPTQTTRQTLALVMPPQVMSYYTRDIASWTVNEPLATVTGDNRHALVIPPMIVSERRNNPAKLLDQPLYTIVANQQERLLIAPPSVGEIDIEALIPECRFRMFEPHELKLGMGFPSSYIILGNKRQQTRQAGNAVVPAVAKAILERCIQSLEG